MRISTGSRTLTSPRPTPDYAPFRDWADRLSTSEALMELERAIAAQDPSRSSMIERAYLYHHHFGGS